MSDVVFEPCRCGSRNIKLMSHAISAIHCDFYCACQDCGARTLPLPKAEAAIEEWKSILRSDAAKDKQISDLDQRIANGMKENMRLAGELEGRKRLWPVFQERVLPWMLECFGQEIADDLTERNHRFLEEALELVQSTGCSRSEAHQLVDYVFDRPVGETRQEIGGVMVTLAALCLAAKENMHEAGEIELRRVWTKVEAIREKQANKPKHSPLPQAHKSSDQLRIERLEKRNKFLERLISHTANRMNNCARAVESNQVVDKDVHGVLVSTANELHNSLLGLEGREQ